MNRAAIVTGGSRGIGKAICLGLAKEGTQVLVNYSSSKKEALDTVEQIHSFGGKAIHYKADVSNSKEVEAMVQAAMDQFGRVDYLINNSGVMLDNLVEDISDDELEKVLAINLKSSFYTCRTLIPYFKKQKFGRIINISSQAALQGSVKHAHYAAAKSGLLGLTFSLAKELGPYGITVNIISPGRIQTEMIETRMKGREEEWMAQTPLKRIGKVEDISNAVKFLVSDEADYITGLNLHVNGGLIMG